MKLTGGMLSYGEVWVSGDLVRLPRIEPLRPRLAERIRSVARLMRLESELSVTLRPRVWLLRDEGGAGAAMMGTVDSCMGAAVGTFWLCSSSSMTISIVPLPCGLPYTGVITPGSGAGGGGGGVARWASSFSIGGGGGGGGGTWSSRDALREWRPIISSMPRILTPAAASALIFLDIEPRRGGLFPACIPIWKPGWAGRPIEP